MPLNFDIHLLFFTDFNLLQLQARHNSVAEPLHSLRRINIFENGLEPSDMSFLLGVKLFLRHRFESLVNHGRDHLQDLELRHLVLLLNLLIAVGHLVLCNQLLLLLDN